MARKKTAAAQNKSTAPQIVARDVVKTYRLGGSTIGALQGLSVEVGRGEYLAVTGASGSGKSTFHESDRRARYADLRLAQGRGSRARPARLRSTRALPQREDRLRVPDLQPAGADQRARQCRAALLYSPRGHANARDKAKACLAKVGLAHREEHQPSELAGGQQQRVAIARALVNEPHILLADESTGALDSRTTEEIIGLFEELNESGITVIIVTHEPDIAKRARRRLTFVDGKIVEDAA